MSTQHCIFLNHEIDRFMLPRSLLYDGPLKHLHASLLLPLRDYVSAEVRNPNAFLPQALNW